MTVTKAKKFTIDEYHRLTELGFFSENDRVELILGEIMQMPAKNTLHSVCNTRLYRELLKLIQERATIRGQEPIIISNNNEPEPDLVIVQNQDDDYLEAHPRPNDILLLIQIADSSLNYDQEVKLTLYAEAGISNYWIFNLAANYLEYYSEPYRDQKGNFGYRRKVIYLPNESVNLPFFPELTLDLFKVFPRMGN